VDLIITKFLVYCSASALFFVVLLGSSPQVAWFFVFAWFFALTPFAWVRRLCLVLLLCLVLRLGPALFALRLFVSSFSPTSV
jgi:hypothetical protein